MQRIRRWLKWLAGHQILESIPLEGWQARRALYKEPGVYAYEEGALTINIGDHLIESGTTMFLEKTVELPVHWAGKPAGLEWKAGAKGHASLQEALLRLDGIPYHGLDRNRSYVPFPALRNDRRGFHVQIELFNPAAQAIDGLNHQNEPAEYDPVSLQLLDSRLVLPNRAVQSFVRTASVYFETAQLLPEGDLHRSAILRALTRTMHASSFDDPDDPDKLRDSAWITGLEASLREELATIKGWSQGMMHMIGQSHIDLAWLWPMKETFRKCSRTFSTMCTLLEEYPEFIYTQSQPQAYAFVKDRYPELYAKIKQHIAAGRWEVIGGMWVEPDLNIPSGESLVRQLLYGMRFYEQEFGARPRVEWLPDTFGYCASLPQLLRKAGLEAFMTTKMNWNDTNPFPYDLFHWVGIDGTKVLAYVNHGLNESTHPKEVKTHWDSYKQKHQHPEQMLLYGHGDGGGGVTREMIEMVARASDLPGLPKAVFSTAHDFFDRIHAAVPELPEWHGDMYLELHRGTYTTHARNKRRNRQAEALYREAEIWHSLAAWSAGKQAKPPLEHGWKLLLLNQFHDIIPGTSIPEVYVQSAQDYETLFAEGEAVRLQALDGLAQRIHTKANGVPVILFNSLSWDRAEAVTLEMPHSRESVDLINAIDAIDVIDEEGRSLPSDYYRRADGTVEVNVHVGPIPAMGYRTVWLQPRPTNTTDMTETPPPAFEYAWETPYYSLAWDERGEMTRLYDKRAGREVLRSGEKGNQLQLFHDRPLYWDAWDIDPRFDQQLAAKAELIHAEVVRTGVVQDILRFKWKLSHSFIEQDIVLSHHSPCIEFRTTVDWHEEHKLLKVAFPVDIVSTKAVYEIPFGVVERAAHNNTSWEQAQFEVCGHRFADVSEGRYGVSLLNDCKYGYDVKDSVLRLSLLRAPRWPDPGADQGRHFFTYSLYPHEGDWRRAGTVRRGYELNQPIQVYMTDSHSGDLPSSCSLIQVQGESCILDTVKPAEDGHGYIVRLYESEGARDHVEIASTSGRIACAAETDLLEVDIRNIERAGDKLAEGMLPFEVKTIRIVPGTPARFVDGGG